MRVRVAAQTPAGYPCTSLVVLSYATIVCEFVNYILENISSVLKFIKSVNQKNYIYSAQEVVILLRKPETHYIVLVCWLFDLIYKIYSPITVAIFSAGTRE